LTLAPPLDYLTTTTTAFNRPQSITLSPRSSTPINKGTPQLPRRNPLSHNGSRRPLRLGAVSQSSTHSSPHHQERQLLTTPHPASDLLRRLNPKHTSDHLNSIISLAPDLTEDLLASVDQPLTVKRCRDTGREYLLCDYNRDGDSYRSPWSNKFDPPLDEAGAGAGGVGAAGSEGAGEGAIPSERVRRMEVQANEAFDVYRELYYEGGVSSVYFWNLDDGFAGVVLLKKCKLTTPPHPFDMIAQLTPTGTQHRPREAAARASGTRSTSSKPSSAAARRTTS
jgi:hypothetical protein